MIRPAVRFGMALFVVGFLWSSTRAAPPLSERIDALVMAKANGRAASPLADDAEFLRRAYLDLAGVIPSVQEARAFLDDTDPGKRAKMIDKLLSGPDYPRRMAEFFHVMLMERRGDHAQWQEYLHSSFAQNKPWDQMAREILCGFSDSKETRGAPFFYSKRLERYGQNPADYPGLTRDVGRMFLGIDLQCAQCHNHVHIKDYKQADYQGLFAFFTNVYLNDPKMPSIGERPFTKKVEFVSVFGFTKKQTGPRVPGMKEIEVPNYKQGEEYARKPDNKKKDPGRLKFSPLSKLAEQVPQSDAFARNAVNRLWFLMMGRGIVHPLDLHHSKNPPSHPELLDLLAKEFVAHKYDIKWLLGEIARSQTYQRSSMLPENQKVFQPESFLTAHEKLIGAEQLMWSVLQATGELERTRQFAAGIDSLRSLFVKAFANPPKEPEIEFNPSLKGALFILNNNAVQQLLVPRPGNLVDRLSKLPDDKVAEELYLSVLTRLPTADEKSEVEDYLAQKTDRVKALQQLAWALLASTEFCVNH